jgi:uncharacterized SAM-binding protein YcdF (DUF218 family)
MPNRQIGSQSSGRFAGLQSREDAMPDDAILALAEVVWDYHQLHHEISTADAILVLCSHDTIVAERGAELFLEGRAPLLIFSGGSGAITGRLWSEPEADRFARVAVHLGVPAARILIENRSTNTGENVRFTRDLLTARGLDPQSVILVQKPYMERRAFATFRKIWPDMPVQVTSPRICFHDYLARYAHDTLTADDVIGIMVGDLQRIRLYPAKGFQIPQVIPSNVWTAYTALVAAGYTRYLVRDEHDLSLRAVSTPKPAPP